MIVLLILIVILVVLGLMLTTTYNPLVGLRQNPNQAFADIDVQLKRRFDLIPNLVETVKGYAAHESGTLEAVVKARAATQQASSKESVISAQGELSGALGKLIALAESYPDLKASENFQQLQGQLSD